MRFPPLPALTTVLIVSGTLAACQSRSPSRTPADTRIAALEDALERQRNAETLVADVEAWIVRSATTTPPADRDRIDIIVKNLSERIARVKPALERKVTAQVNNAALSRELADLANAYDRAVAGVPAERRAAEEAMAARMDDIGDRIAAYHVALASAGVQANAEARRRMTQLDLARREAAQTLAELRRGGPGPWPWVHRRWLAQTEAIDDLLRESTGRLPALIAAATPTPAAPPEKNIPARPG